ncbi:MAG TPA: IS110 family transposase [Bryobacteraceae bacterium]
MATRKKSTRGRLARAKLKPQDWTLGLEVVHSQAAGIDVGSEEHWVAIPPSLDDYPVRSCGCFTEDLRGLVEWLKSRGITTVALQSTGVYWIPLYDLLEQSGIQVFLVNARDTKNLPGRKTDIQECQWLLKLHVYGLLRNSFRPPEQVLKLRTYWRQRQQHIADAARCVQRMQKALTQMNLQLTHVLSDITGASGQAILRAILNGERNPQVLAQWREPNVKASAEEVAKSLAGNWREDLLFVLQQEYDNYQMFQKRIEECDRRLKAHYETAPSQADPKTLGPAPRNKRGHGNVPRLLDLRQELYRSSGGDLTAIDGINVLTAQTILAEVGADMSSFATEAKFASYLGLCPNHKMSGGKVVGRDLRKTVSRAGLALRQAASSLLRSQSYLGAQYRRLRSKLGAPKAMKAMANRLARIIYRMLKFGQAYIDKGQQFYDDKYRSQQIAMLHKKAAALGLQLTTAASSSSMP